MTIMCLTYFEWQKWHSTEFAKLFPSMKSWLHPRILRMFLFLFFVTVPTMEAAAQSFVVSVGSLTGSSSNNPAVAGRGYPFTITRDGGSGLDSTYSGTHTLSFSSTAAVPQICAPVANDCTTRNSCQAASGNLDISFNGGVVNLCMVMPDVGAYSFSVTEGGANGSSPGFISHPAYLTLTDVALVKRGDLAVTCNSPFSYMSEPMKLSFTITAMSEENLITPSYDGTKLNGAINTINQWTAAIAPGSMGLMMTGVDNGRVSVSSPSASNWTNGAAVISAYVSFARGGAPDGPYPNAVLGIAPQDDDGVTLRDTEKNMDADGNGVNDRLTVGTTVLRYGRLKIANAYGSDVLALPVNVQAQYWNGTAYVDNTDDSCTPLDGNFVLGQVGSLPQPNTTVASNSGNKLGDKGLGQITLTKPSPAITTKAITSINTNSTNLPYLPGLGTGTFGVYRGGPVIYRRELHY